METKFCNRCKQELSVEEFSKSSSSKDGYYCWCKKCSKQYREETKDREKERYEKNIDKIHAYKKQYRIEHLEEIKEKQKIYRENNRELLSEKQKARAKKRKEEDPEIDKSLNRRYGAYKAGAKKRHLDFELSKEKFDEITKLPCIYCGDYSDSYHNNCFSGVDRINSNLGYFTDNCVPCCTICNQMKSNISLKKFYDKIKKINERITCGEALALQND